MTTANEPTYLRMTHDIDGEFVVEYKVSPHGDEDPDRGSWFVDTKAEAEEAVASLKLAATAERLSNKSDSQCELCECQGDDVPAYPYKTPKLDGYVEACGPTHAVRIILDLYPEAV